VNPALKTTPKTLFMPQKTIVKTLIPDHLTLEFLIFKIIETDSILK